MSLGFYQNKPCQARLVRRTILSHKHGGGNVNGKIFFVHVQEAKRRQKKGKQKAIDCLGKSSSAQDN